MDKPKAKLFTAQVTGSDYTDMAAKLVTRYNEQLAASALEPAALGPGDDKAHEHLMKDCSWYARVAGGEDPGDPTHWEGCTPAGKPAKPSARPALQKRKGALVKFTPRTPEASTVDKPTVPPGGPGLFHHKGLHLPPYIQHLWFHLVARYGKEKAYGVAVGVVKKWAAGVNPGGKKPTKTHPDVKAAAARNVAEWERDKAMGHDKVKATVALAYPVPGVHPLPPVPASSLEKAIFTAHRIDDIVRHLSHAAERMIAARKAAADVALRNYNVLHLDNHLLKGLDDANNLADNLRKNYPAEGEELDRLVETMALAKALNTAGKVATTPHLLQTIVYNLAHAQRHARLLLGPGDQKVWDFNADHAEKHVKGAMEHAQKLASHIHDNYPAESRWLRQLEKDAGQAAVKLAQFEASVDNLEFPPAKLKVTEEPEIRLAADAASPKGTMTAPGTRVGISAQLKHVPSQTVAAGPPLPPGVSLPTPQEVDKLAVDVAADSPGYDSPVLTGAVKHLRDAAQKLRKEEYVHALSSLRSAQTGILSAHREVRSNSIPVANVFTIAARVPPAAASSMRAEMAETVAEREKFRKHYMAVSALIDRVRRYHFHGMYGGLAEARFSGEEMRQAMEALALARARPVP